MSTLATALAALGGVVLAGVLGHGVWQARRAGPKKAEPVTRQEPTAGGPAPGETREPVLGESGRGDGGSAGQPAAGSVSSAGTSGAAAGRPAAWTANDGASPADGGGAAHSSGATDASGWAPSEPFIDVKPAPRRVALRLDALIDALAAVTLEAPISAELALTHLPASRRAGSKPFFIEGLNADSGEWEQPTLGQRYGEFQAGVQLANRTGALNEIEYSEFVQKVQAFTEAIGGMVDFPDMLDVVSRARELDAFSSQYDAQLGVHLRARDVAWSVGYVHQHAARHGFALGGVPGRMVLPSAQEGAPPVLTLSFDSQAALAEDPSQAAVRDLTLTFDVPQTEASADPFATWQRSAEALAKDIDGVIVDDNGHPLHPQSFASIGNELGQLYEALAKRDVAAGSMAARRLFS